jgi:hypothetical protein
MYIDIDMHACIYIYIYIYMINCFLVVLWVLCVFVVGLCQAALNVVDQTQKTQVLCGAPGKHKGELARARGRLTEPGSGLAVQRQCNNPNLTAPGAARRVKGLRDCRWGPAPHTTPPHLSPHRP